MKQHLRSVCMVLAFLVGGLLHAELAPLADWLPVGITLMLCITFIGLDTSQLKPTWMHLILLLVLQLMALFFWGIAAWAGYPVLAESLYYCAAAPVASAAPVIVSLLRGNTAFITTAMVLSQAVFGLITPILLPFVVDAPGLGYVDFLLVVLYQLMLALGAPALISFLLRVCYPPCKQWAPRLRDYSLAIWIINLTIVSAAGTHRLLQMDYGWSDIWPIAFGALFICAFGFLFGYRLGYPNLKRECSQALGQKNTILTLYIAGQPYATPLAYIGPAFYVFFHNIANAVQLSLALKEQKKSGVDKSSVMR